MKSTDSRDVEMKFTLKSVERVVRKEVQLVVKGGGGGLVNGGGGL